MTQPSYVVVETGKGWAVKRRMARPHEGVVIRTVATYEFPTAALAVAEVLDRSAEREVT